MPEVLVGIGMDAEPSVLVIWFIL